MNYQGILKYNNWGSTVGPSIFKGIKCLKPRSVKSSEIPEYQTLLFLPATTKYEYVIINCAKNGSIKNWMQHFGVTHINLEQKINFFPICIIYSSKKH